jgi:hypothetical protein
MKFLDFIYFIYYKAYLKGNKESMGAFFISSLWISLLQFLWVIIFLVCSELCFEEKLIMFFDKLLGFAICLFLIVVLNNIYLSFGDRKRKILNQFHFSEQKERLYWILLTLVFFISLILAGRMGFLRKEMFG